MQEQYSEAIAELEKAVKADSRQPDAWTLLGLSEFETKDYKNARLHLERANELGFGGNAAAVKVAAYHLAVLLILEGQFDRATDLLIPLVGPGPMESQIQFAMGLAILRVPQLPEQLEESRKPVVSNAGAAAAQLAQTHYDQAFPMFDAMLLQYPETPYLHYAYGAALANISEFDRAQVQLREEIRMNPDSPLPYIRLASVLLTVHQPETSLSFAKKAVQLAPNSPDAHYVLGRAMLEHGDSDQAVSELEIARQLAPGSPAVHFNLARAYTKTHRDADAQRERAEFERLNQIMNGQNASQRAAGGLSQATEGRPASNPAH
jgi:predicted Zn-dependent protease